MERIEWIDYMKGFAILIVVMGHISQSLLRTYQFSNLILVFEMPLFFTLAGVLADKTSHRPFWLNLKKKFFSLIVPLIVVGSFNSLVTKHFHYFLFAEIHNGYWFLLSLFWCWMLFLPISKLTMKLKSYIHKPILGEIIEFIILLLPFFIYNKYAGYISTDINNLLSLPYTFTYYRFFVVGYFIGKFWDKHILNDKWGGGIILIVFSFVIIKFFLPESLQLIPIIITQLVLSTGLMYVLYKYCQVTNNKIKKMLLQFGRGSLAIYILHFFIKPYANISFASEFSEFWVILITLFTAILVCYSCLIIAIPIEHNKLLRKYVLGKI